MSIRNKIKISLNKKDKAIDIALSFDLDLRIEKKEVNNFYEIVLHNLSVIKSLRINKADVLNFQLNEHCDYIFSIYCFEDMFVEGAYFEEFRIKANLESYIKKKSINFYMRIINDWNLEKKSYHWSNLSLFQKRLWLNACMDWNGIQKEITNLDHFLLFDCKRVIVKEDFYCYLGELFFGYGGYIGQNLDALDDCLSQIKNKNLYILKFSDFNSLAEILNNYTKRNDYSDMILEILRDNNIRIDLGEIRN